MERRSGRGETARDTVVRRTPLNHNRSLINDITKDNKKRLPAVNHLLCWCLNVYGRRWRQGEIQLLDGGFHRSAER